MSDKFISTWFRASLDTFETEEGLFVKQNKTHYSQRAVDFDEFAELLKTKYEELDSRGYDVINVTPLQMGHSDPSIARDKGYVGDVGFSITRGAVVIGKKRD